MIEAPYTWVRKSFVDPSPAWGINNLGGTVFIRCGGCKKCVNLSEGHRIGDDGIVYPSVRHDDGDKCQWHENIKLLDYWIITRMGFSR